MVARQGVLARFGSDARGNVAMTFALALVPLIAATGSAFDYTRALATRTHLQAAVDATAVAVARAAPTRSDAELASLGQAYFSAQFGTHAGVSVPPIKVSKLPRTVRVEAKGEVVTTLMKVLRFDSMGVAASSEASWGRKVEVVLALDNTGSMNDDGKMPALRQATELFLKTMEGASAAGRAQGVVDPVKVGLVPFAVAVKLPTSAARAPWLRYDPGSYNGWLRGVTPANWEGCVHDRDLRPDQAATPPAPGRPETQWLGGTCGGYLAEMRPLTTSFTDLRATAAAMFPSGSTNIAMGVQVGLASLTEGAPLSNAAARSAGLDKVLIVFTDGENTQNRFGELTTQIDRRTRETCEAAKTAGVKVYTIRLLVKTPDSVLGPCAGNGGTYHDVKDVTQLAPLFESLARDIAGIRFTS